MATPVAYFITFSTYGTWLHGRTPGSVDRQHNAPGTPFLPDDASIELATRQRMTQPEYRLNADQRTVVLRTIIEVAHHRRWQIRAVHVRSNHVHVIVTATATPEKVMSDLKAWASRRLRETFAEDANRNRWTQHGSTRYLWTQSALAAKIAYVVDEQGDAMAVFDSRSSGKETPGTVSDAEPEAQATD